MCSCGIFNMFYLHASVHTCESGLGRGREVILVLLITCDLVLGADFNGDHLRSRRLGLNNSLSPCIHVSIIWRQGVGIRGHKLMPLKLI